MLTSYFKIIIRSLFKDKTFSFIKIAGLSIGLASAILILLWVQDEMTYDRFHINANYIYRVLVETNSINGVVRSANTPNALGPVLRERYPEIINFTRYMGGYSGWLIKYGNKSFTNDRWAAADPSFFKIFSFPFIHGDPNSVFNDRYNVVITDEMARKYFGDEYPVGKIIQKDNTDLKVTGVIEIPQNSHLQFDYIFPVVNMKEWFIQDLESWEPGPLKTYLLTSETTLYKELSTKIAGIIGEFDPQSKRIIQIQPFKNIHLHTDFQDDACNYKQGNAFYVYIFLSVALCILLIACINFMNLTIARSANRGKEVGIRKVIGAKKSNIFFQFWGETFVFTIIALVIAIVLADLLLPHFNYLSGKQLSLGITENITIIGGLILLALGTGLMAGSYPALFLSSILPIKALQAFIFSSKNKHAYLQKVLLIFQFTIAILLIISTTVIYHQLMFMKNKDLGYDHQNIVYFYGHGKFSSNYESLRSELLNHPNILGVSKSFAPFFPETDQSSDIEWEGRTIESEIVIYLKTVDYDYLNTFNLKMVEGSFFSRDFHSEQPQFIINETAAQILGIEQPTGKHISYKGQSGTIIGVLKDFHNSSLHTKIQPSIYSLYNGPCYINIKMGSINVQQTLEFIEQKYSQYLPDRPFSYLFFDSMIENYYRSEKRVGAIVTYFAALAIFISCLGLLGLTSYNISRRTKEIGIRKVVGATIVNILFMLTRDFTQLVLMANLIAWPIAYITMNKWLQNFAYGIDLTVWPFVFAGAAALGIALITISWQAICAATTNPVESLRYE
jgi:putative ABC transport system permease protein